MQKVAAGKMGSFQGIEKYLNQQLKKNPGWRIEHLCMVDNGLAGPGIIIVFEGPDNTDGPKVQSDTEHETQDE